MLHTFSKLIPEVNVGRGLIREATPETQYPSQIRGRRGPRPEQRSQEVYSRFATATEPGERLALRKRTLNGLALANWLQRLNATVARVSDGQGIGIYAKRTGWLRGGNLD